MENTNNNTEETQTVRIRDILWSVWQHKFVCGAIVAAFVFMAVIWLGMTRPTYKATMIIMPAESIGGGGNSIAKQASEISSILGMSLGGNAESVSYFAQNLAMMRTVDLHRRLDKKYDLKKRIFHDMWDAKTQTWHPPSSIVSRLKRFIKSALGYPDWSAPDDLALTIYMGGRLNIIDHKIGTSLKRLEFMHGDPEFALEALLLTYNESNLILRSNLKASSEKMIEYLSRRVENIVNSEHRQVLFSLILEQERNLLLLDGAENPGAIILDPPTVSSNPFYPKVTLTLVLSFMIGVLGAIGYAFSRALTS